MKKFIALAAALVIGSVSAFAYDFDDDDIDVFEVKELGTISSKQFDKIWGDDGSEFFEYIDEAMEERGYDDVDYDYLDDDDFEDIDQDAVDFAEAELKDMKIKNGVYVCIITPDFDEDYDDEFDEDSDFFGWVFVANVNKSKVTDIGMFVMSYDTED